MAIDYNRFLSWVESRFSPDDIKLGKNDEIRLRSIFHPDDDDRKFRLYCSPSGGKKKRINGVFHCFDTDIKGSLIKFVMLVDNCTHEDAIEILNGSNASLDRLQKLADEVIYGNKKEEKKKLVKLQEEDKKKEELQLPPFTYHFHDLPSDNYHRIHGEAYLFNRKLPLDDFMVCVRGDEFRNRIVIPYYDVNGKLIYYNGRYIGNSSKVAKYQFPDKEIVDRANVLYFPKWPEPGVKVYLTEGEFDAYSLHTSGLPSAAFGGKHLAETQIELIRSYIPVLCLDSDKAGEAALSIIGDNLLQQGFPRVYYVRPPKQIKDWNEFLQKIGPNVLKTYILQKEKPYTSWTSTALGYNKI